MFVNAKNNETNEIKIHYNNLDEFTTSYFNIYPNGSIENTKDEDIGNLLYDNIFDVLELKQKELVNHKLRKNY